MSIFGGKTTTIPTLIINDPVAMLRYIELNAENGIKSDLIDIASLVMLCEILRELRNR